jgi:L-lactate dehydrogenase complex protein LldF
MSIRPFPERTRDALADPDVRSGLTSFQRGWRSGRDHRVAELEAAEGRTFDELRAELAAIKDEVRADWDTHLDRFTAQARRAGSVVTRVATAREANDVVLDLLERHGVSVLVKGKSMVSEEIGLNAELEKAGIAAIETDLGEWILQLAGETPSHLVMPAIHKRKERIAELMERTLGRAFPPDDIDRMVKAARTELRARFLASGAGLSGANALIAEGGTTMIVCNEGNNRMSVALPPLHIITAGIEKLVPTFADAMLQVRLLARSATAQEITVYTNFITGPRPGQQQHILLLDNGRTVLAEDPVLAASLRCIRCGACANVCPPYGVVGGHAFGHVYTGAIGLVVTAAHHGLDAAAGPQSLCVSCNACATVCPVDIPLPLQILEVRRRVVEAHADGGAGRVTRLTVAALRHRRVVAVVLPLLGLLMLPLRDGDSLRVPRVLRRLPRVATQVRWRTPPAVPIRPARSRLRSESRTETRTASRTASVSSPTPLPAPAGPPVLRDRPLEGRRVLLLLQCLSDRLAPGIPIAAARLLRAAGAEVIVPQQQHCCGLPAYDAGLHVAARALLAQTVATFDGPDDVVTPASSCLAMLRHDGPALSPAVPSGASGALDLAARSYDLLSYLTTGPGRLPAGSLDDGDRTPITVHRFCQASNVLGRGDAIERFLAEVTGAPVVTLDEAAECCGFGGSTSLRHPAVAEGILHRKLECIDRSAARVVVTDNPGCILHLRGGIAASGREVRVLHLAEFLAARLGPEAQR